MTVLGIVLANVLHAVLPPKIVAVRSTAASPRKPSELYCASETAESSSVGAPSVRFGAVPLHVRRYRSLLPPCWSQRIMKSPEVRFAHGLQFAVSCASVAVS